MESRGSSSQGGFIAQDISYQNKPKARDLRDNIGGMNVSYGQGSMHHGGIDGSQILRSFETLNEGLMGLQAQLVNKVEGV